MAKQKKENENLEEIRKKEQMIESLKDEQYELENEDGAKNYHYPITDIKGFNQLLKDSGIKAIKRKTIKEILNY